MKSIAEHFEQRIEARKNMREMTRAKPRLASVIVATKVLDLQREQQERIRKRK